MANKQRTKEEVRKRKLQRYNYYIKRLDIFAYITIALAVVAIFLFFVPWACIYNSQSGYEDCTVNGWNCILSAISNGYSSSNTAIYGKMQTYYYWTDYHNATAMMVIISWLSTAAFILVIAALALKIAAFACKKQGLNIAASVLEIVVFLLLVMSFVFALSTYDQMVSPSQSFCQGNLNCSIQSFAIIPAVLYLACGICDLITSISRNKYYGLIKQLQNKTPQKQNEE